MDITATWARATTLRMQKGGDLYRRPWTREEMTAPLAWHEKQLAVVYRFGELSDGSTGYARLDNRVDGAEWTERAVAS